MHMPSTFVKQAHYPFSSRTFQNYYKKKVTQRALQLTHLLIVSRAVIETSSFTHQSKNKARIFDSHLWGKLCQAETDSHVWCYPGGDQRVDPGIT